MKRYNRAECIVVGVMEVESEPVQGFESSDLEEVATPHNDSLVIRAIVANYDVARVFVDASNSVNVLFWVALEKMRMNVRDL